MRWFENVLRDLCHGARSLRRSPGLVLVSLLSLGLGIGLNLALYAGVSTIFGHQPTLASPERVVGIEPGNARQWSYPNYRDLRDSGTVHRLAGFRVSSMNRRLADAEARVSVLVVTDNFFDDLGIAVRLGRTFHTGDAAPERTPREAVLSHSYWRAQLGADPGVIGQPITLDGDVFTIVGVLPEDYRAITGFVAPGLYVPASARTLPALEDRRTQTLNVLALLAPGDSIQPAQARVTAVAAELERRFPDINEGLSRPAQVFPASALQFRGTPAGFRLLPAVLLVLFGLVLLIGAMNVAGLLLARAVARQHELTMRTALGASRADVIQALVAEGFLLSLLGLGAGVGVAVLLSQTSASWSPGPLQNVLAVDRQLLLPGILLVLFTTLVCGIVPALQASRVDVLAGLRRTSANAGGRMNLRTVFVMGQIAVSLTLLVVSSLCLRSQARIADLDFGFDFERAVVVRFAVDPISGPADARQTFTDRLVQRLEHVPGVQSAAVTALVPLGGDALVASFHPAGRTDIPGTRPSTISVGPRYFESLAIPRLAGRDFDAGDRDGRPPVAIVNETFASTYFPGRNAIGERIDIGGESEAEVVGIVRDHRIDTIGEAPKSVVFYPFAQRPRRLTVIARTAGDPSTMLASVRAAVNDVAGTSGVNVMTMKEAAGVELSMRRVGTEMAGAIGLLGLFLTAMGLYGVVSHLVASRTAELGIRMALGATSGRLVREVLLQSAGVVAVGAALGLVLSLLFTPLLRTFLAGLSPLDPAAFAVAGAVLLIVTLTASYVPARRAARIDPSVALRE